MFERDRERDWSHAGIAVADGEATGHGLAAALAFDPRVSAKQHFME